MSRGTTTSTRASSPRSRTPRAIGGTDKINALGFCIGGTLLARPPSCGAGERKMASLSLLTTLLDFTDVGEIRVYIDENFVEKREKQIAEAASCPAASSPALSQPARQRPGLVVRGEQLPQGQAAAGLRPALLERRRDQPAGADVRYYLRNTYEDNSSPKPDAVCGVPVSLKPWTCPPSCSRRARTTSCPGGRPKERGTWRGRDLRSRRERPRRRHHQPGGDEQAQLLDRRQVPPGDPISGSRGEGATWKLVDRVVEMAGAQGGKMVRAPQDRHA